MSILSGAMLAEQAKAQPAGVPGSVNFFVDAGADFSVWLDQPSDNDKQFMRDNYFRMQVYAPYFDSRLSWYPDAWDYKDAYGMLVSGSEWVDHPEWILNDAIGNALFIPFACDGSTCPRYAGDFGNPAFRADWIAKQKTTMEAGYTGIWIDDVNLASIKAGNGSGDLVAPIDPRTGQPMTLSDWRRYFAEFMEDVRAAFPDVRIVHNVHWWTDRNDPSVVRQLLAADTINLERGISDAGITNGSGTFGFESFIALIDWLHGQGRQVILDDDDDTGDQERDYELAFYHLINNGGDLLGADGDRSRMTPGNFWSGYTVDLGDSAGDHYKWNELFRRDFECGLVLVNQPGMPSITVDLGEVFTTIAGQSVNSVTLAASTGRILRKLCDPVVTITAIDDAVQISAGENAVIDVLANDQGLGNGPVEVVIASEPAMGTSVLNPEMQILYTPGPGVSGVDSFEYTVSNEAGAVSALATVTVTISSPADPGSGPMPEPEPEPGDETTGVSEIPEIGEDANGGEGSAIDILSIVLLVSTAWIRRRTLRLNAFDYG